jgi:hypothetical protein
LTENDTVILAGYSPTPLFNGYWVMFPFGGGGLRISHGKHSHLLMRLRMHLAFHYPICHQDVKETVQQNFFNPMSDNLEILLIQHLRRVVPRAEVLLFTRKELHL